MTRGVTTEDLVRRAGHIGETSAGPAAADVDRRARFPAEALAGLRADGFLSVLVPAHLGGGGASVGQVAEAVIALARHCASTAMVFAMHQIQVACLIRHGGFERYLKEVVAGQLLLASATSEEGCGGDLRSSSCAVEHEGGRFRLEKRALVISYGAHADGVLATARRGPECQPGDQVLVLCRPPGLVLDQTGNWDTLGFRGTCSPPFLLTAEGADDQVFADTFADISSQTMVPVAHILWSAVWLGVAASAVERAGSFVRAQARRTLGVSPPAATRLAELTAQFAQMRELVVATARRYDELADDRDTVAGLGFAIAVNALKVSASTLVVDVVGRAMTICGMAGYREDSPYSLGRMLRDAHGGAVMISNDRINANSAQMLLVHKEDPR